MPTHLLNKTLRVFLYTLLASASLAKAHQHVSIELPEMTVFATKKADNTYVQTSEVAWLDANDLSIVAESNGTYTATSTTQPYSLMAFLESLGRPRLNIDFGYAADSVSMTAEGNLALNTLLEALEYLRAGQTLEISPTFDGSKRANRVIMQRRLEVLRKTLEISGRVNFKVMPAKVLVRNRAGALQSDVWRVQFRRGR